MHACIHTYMDGIYLIERGLGRGRESCRKRRKTKVVGSNRESLIELR